MAPEITRPHAFSNEAVQQAMIREVAARIPGGSAEGAVAGPLSANYFSFTFPLDIPCPAGVRSLYVKVPKECVRGDNPGILPISSQDSVLYESERESLNMLKIGWHADDLDVRWISIFCELPEYNAIVTERIFSDEAFAVFRALDRNRRLLGCRQDARRMRAAMLRLGAAFGRFHKSHASAVTLPVSTLVPKIDYYAGELARETGSPWPERAAEAVRRLAGLRLDGLMVPTLKGVDIRNVLIDEQDRLCLLDPGRTKPALCEADLSRFLMTYRILYWGSMQLPLFGEPDPLSQRAFLDGYGTSCKLPSPVMLEIFLVKELLKHWHTGMESLRHKGWPRYVVKLVSALYIAPFYSGMVRRQIASLAASWKSNHQQL